jgi:arylsulfatase A-like enzyme
MKLHYYIVLLLFIVSFSSCQKNKILQAPNIIFLLTDDQRADALGVAGNDIIQTPNLDKLANDGVRFLNAYVTTSICCVSRASIFSGQYMRRHGIDNFSSSFSDESWTETYPALLKNGGYKTGFIGKFGVGKESEMPKQTFDYWRGFGGQGKYENEDDEGNFIHLTEKMGNQAIEFIQDFSGESPFCLSLSFKAPHCQDGDLRQFIFDPKFENVLAETTIPEQLTNRDEIYETFPAEWRKENEARTRWEIRFSTPEKYQEMVKGYYRLIYGVDVVVGRIRGELEKLGLAENTVILLMGDNGFYLGEHGLAGKWYGHEESIRVPMLVYDPRNLNNGTVKEQMTLNIDIAPTILELAGIEKPVKMQGESVINLIEGTAKNWRNEFFYEHFILKRGEVCIIPGSEGVVGKDFKYVRYMKEPGNYIYEEMFDRKGDKTELNNLVGSSGFYDLKTSLIQKTENYIEELK